tara:strand:+ start:956 stop:1258 length:303 start_codon:yes stop_codon:yes gene_type:complete
MSVISTDIKKYQITITVNAYEGTEEYIVASIKDGMEFEEGEGIIGYSVEAIEEESYVRDLSDNSVSGIYIETPRDYCLECGSDYKLLTHEHYGCPCCDAM